MALEAIERVNQAEEAARGKKEQAAEQAKTLMMEAEKSESRQWQRRPPKRRNRPRHCCSKPGKGKDTHPAGGAGTG